MDSIVPILELTWTTSPTLNGFSEIKNIPLIILEKLVCDAKPIATPKIPAAPKIAERWKPNSFTALPVKSEQLYNIRYDN
jgi:hypothetical protein